MTIYGKREILPLPALNSRLLYVYWKMVSQEQFPLVEEIYWIRHWLVTLAAGLRRVISYTLKLRSKRCLFLFNCSKEHGSLILCLFRKLCQIDGPTNRPTSQQTHMRVHGKLHFQRRKCGNRLLAYHVIFWRHLSRFSCLFTGLKYCDDGAPWRIFAIIFNSIDPTLHFFL